MPRWGIELNAVNDAPLRYHFPFKSTRAPDPLYIAPNAVILGGSKQSYKAISLSIGDYRIEDVARLKVLGPLPVSISQYFDASKGILSLSGEASGWQYTQAIQNVVYSLEGNVRLALGSTNRQFNISISLTDIAFCGQDGFHFYEFIKGVITWTAARAAAEKKELKIGPITFNGYLATITSEEENNCVMQKVAAQGWIGAADLERIDEWRWVTGPEGKEEDGKGRLFWKGREKEKGGRSIGGHFQNWGPGEPNNFNGVGEHYAHTFSSGLWNDFRNNDQSIQGYYVEYSSNVMQDEELKYAVSLILIDVCMDQCNGVYASDSNSCSGHGECVDVNTCQCEIGYGGANCEQCTKGYWTDHISDDKFSCFECEVGHYQNVSGSTSCHQCQLGQFQGKKGSTECEICPQGEYSDHPGSEKCEKCFPGTFANRTGSHICDECDIGYYQPEHGANICLACPEGTFSNSTGSDFCHHCIPGYYQPNAAETNCIQCPAGSYSNITGAASCEQCNEGYYQSNDSSTTCIPCSAGSYSNITGATSCEHCFPGTFQPDNSSTECIPCPAGSYSNKVQSTKCLECPIGTFQIERGSTTCISCEAGTYSNTTGSTSCIHCPPGTYQSEIGGVVCDSCPAGSYSDVYNSTSCKVCSPGTFTNNTESSYCHLCEPGYYQPDNSSVQCIPCPAGTYANIFKSIACIQCDIGYFQDAKAGTRCFPCPKGYFSFHRGRPNCVQCPNGYHENDNGLVSTCLPCPDGSILSELGDQCLSCPVGTFTNQFLGNNCNPCLEGSFAEKEGSTDCELCPIGHYQNNTGHGYCEPCPPGHISERATGSEQCLKCPRGYYTAESGSPECSPCGFNSVAPYEGSSSCDECPKSFSSNGTHCQDFHSSSLIFDLSISFSVILPIASVVLVCMWTTCLIILVCALNRYLIRGFRRKSMTAIIPTNSDQNSNQYTNYTPNDSDFIVDGAKFSSISRTQTAIFGMETSIRGELYPTTEMHYRRQNIEHLSTSHGERYHSSGLPASDSMVSNHNRANNNANTARYYFDYSNSSDMEDYDEYDNVEQEVGYWTSSVGRWLEGKRSEAQLPPGQNDKYPGMSDNSKEAYVFHQMYFKEGRAQEDDFHETVTSRFTAHDLEGRGHHDSRTSDDNISLSNLEELPIVRYKVIDSLEEENVE